MGCERQTAKLRNRTVESMVENDIRSVTYRYLQSKSGEKTTRCEVIFYGIFSIFALCGLCHVYSTINNTFKDNAQEDELKNLIFILFYPSLVCITMFLNVLPNVCNTLGYRETKNSCEAWLTQKLGKEDFQKIEKLSYSRESFFKVNKLLDEKNISLALENNIPSKYKYYIKQ